MRSPGRRGIRAGDRAAVLAENSSAWIIAFLAGLASGLIVVPLAIRWLLARLPAEIADAVGYTGCCGMTFPSTPGEKPIVIFKAGQTEQGRKAALEDTDRILEVLEGGSVIAHAIQIDNLTNDASFMEDLGADSLDTVELVMAFEKEFDIDIPDEDAEKLRTVGDAVAYLNSKVAA